MTRLEQDKEKFLKDIEVYYQEFQKVKTFKNIDDLKEFAVDANRLEDKFDNARNKIIEFNKRERLF